MAAGQQTYSEAWHRVADLRIALRPSVRTRKQIFRGQTWYLLQDPFSSDFYRLPTAALQFIKRLNKNRSVAQVWAECLERSPETAPGQEEVIQLLAQLYQANLLLCELPLDSQQLFLRYKRQQQRETRSKLLNLMFIRIPLFDPNQLLDRYQWLARLLTGRIAATLWCLMLFLALSALLGQHDALTREVRHLLNPGNLIPLYFGLFLIKTLHEAGHCLVCRKFGGEVHTVGIMLIFFTPLPYMDATASWAFRARRQRILTAAAGMIFELFAAACAALLWASTGPGSLHNLAFNLMILASVSTLVFNLNPLLRYDGYYILSDLLDIPNLQQRSFEQIRFLAHRWWFGDRQLPAASDSSAEACWLTLFALASGAYKVLVYGSILLFVADRFLLLGLLLALFCLFSWGVLPLARLTGYLFSPQLARYRWRAIGGGLAGIFFCATLLGLVPVPHHFRAPGVVEAESLVPILNDSPGQLLEILVANDRRVSAGDALARLINPELEIETSLIKAQQEEVQAQLQQSIALAGGEARQMLEKQLTTLAAKSERLLRQKNALLVNAPVSGIWVARAGERLKGGWLKRGTVLGQIVVNEGYNFSAVVSQDQATNLFDKKSITEIEVRLSGQSATPIPISDFKIIPFQQQQLPSAALGLMSGGSIAVAPDDRQGLRTLEPYFRIDAALPAAQTSELRHGHSGQIRFDLPAEPLLKQGVRLFRQFFQHRYQT